MIGVARAYRRPVDAALDHDDDRSRLVQAAARPGGAKHPMSLWRRALLLALAFWPMGSLVAEDLAIFWCPSSKGLCRWQDGAWTAYWEPSTAEPLIDFMVLDDRVVALLRGHMSPGRMVLLDKNGEILLIRHLATGRSLRSVTGFGPHGLMLCNGTIGASWCDTWFPEETTADTPRTPSLPDNCLFPRFTSGIIGCVEEAPEPILRVTDTSPLSGRYRSLTLSFEGAQWLEHVHPAGESKFFVQADQRLFLVDTDGEARLVSEGEVNQSYTVGEDHVVFSQCSTLEDLGVTQCSLALTTSDGHRTEIWRSNQFSPVHLVALAAEEFLVQLASETESALVLVRKEGHDWTSRDLWRRLEEEEP